MAEPRKSGKSSAHFTITGEGVAFVQPAEILRTKRARLQIEAALKRSAASRRCEAAPCSSDSELQVFGPHEPRTG